MVYSYRGYNIKHEVIEALFILLLLFGLCGCNDVGTQIEANESTFLVNFHVDCDEDVYGICFEYYLDGAPAGGGLIGNADGSVIRTGYVFTKDFISTDFPENADLSQFQLEIFAVDRNGDEYTCGIPLEFAVEYGEVYDISITGSYEGGLSANIM